MKSLILFDLTPLLLSRLPQSLAAALKGPSQCSLISTEDKAYWDLLEGQGWNHIDGLIIFGHRLPDICLLIVANQRNVPVYYVQHGLFKERLQRSLWSIIPLMQLKLRYYLSSFLKARKAYRPVFTFGLLVKLFNAAFLSNREIARILTTTDSYISTTFVYDSIQVDVYRKIFGYHAKKIVEIGFLDSGRLDLSAPKEKLAILICQSLVEDGRLAERDYRRALTKAIVNCERDGWTIMLFLHQRSDPKLYERFGLLSYVTSNAWHLPSAELYLTDYSTFILEPLSRGRKVSRVSLSGHAPMAELEEIPEYPKILHKKESKMAASPFTLLADHIEEELLDQSKTH